MSNKERKEYIKKCGSCGKKIKYYHGEKPSKCPYCNNKYWDKPKTEIELFELQDKYLQTKDKQILSKMYLILVEYAQSLIFKMYSKYSNSGFTFRKDILEEKCHDSANGIILYYLQKPDFKINESFAGYLIRKIRETLYSDKLEENHESLNYIFDDHNNQELLAILEQVGYTEILSDNKVNTNYIIDKHSHLEEDIIKIINIACDEIKKQYSFDLALSVLIGIKLFIEKKSEIFQSKYYFWRGGKTREFVNKIMLIINNYLEGKPIYVN